MDYRHRAIAIKTLIEIAKECDLNLHIHVEDGDDGAFLFANFHYDVDKHVPIVKSHPVKIQVTKPLRSSRFNEECMAINKAYGDPGPGCITLIETIAKASRSIPIDQFNILIARLKYEWNCRVKGSHDTIQKHLNEIYATHQTIRSNMSQKLLDAGAKELHELRVAASNTNNRVFKMIEDGKLEAGEIVTFLIKSFDEWKDAFDKAKHIPDEINALGIPKSFDLFEEDYQADVNFPEKFKALEILFREGADAILSASKFAILIAFHKKQLAHLASVGVGGDASATPTSPPGGPSM